MTALEESIPLREAARSALAAHGLVLEDIEVSHPGGPPQVRIIADLPADQLGSADLEDLAAASQDLSERIDADDSVVGPDPVLLEVTTPGVDRELTAPHHFRRARGRLLEIELADATRLRARVLAVGEDDVLRLRQEPGRDERGRPRKLAPGTTEQLEIAVDAVRGARVQIEFTPPPDLAQLIADAESSVPKES